MRGCWCIHAYEYNGKIEVGGWCGEIHPGMISLVPPRARLVHHWQAKNFRHAYMHFRIPRQKRATVPVTAVAGSTDEKISDLLRSCAVSHRVQPEAKRATLWQALWGQHVSTSPEDPVFSVQNYIAQHLAEPISLPVLTRHVRLSTNQLNRIFKARIGETVASYWRTRRIENAAGLLRHTSLSIKAAAIQCGYTDLQQFNNLVRAHCGLAPRKFAMLKRRAL
jgi:AraC-like DNA-binding protein